MLKGLFFPFIAPILAVAGKDWRRMGAQCLVLVAPGAGVGVGAWGGGWYRASSLLLQCF